MKRLFAIVFPLFLVACGPKSPSDSGPIRIGFIGPITGDVASIGSDVLYGVRLAVEEVNMNGGVNGREIQLIVEDGLCTGKDASSAAQKLIHVDKVVAIVGGICSGETLAAAPIAEEAKIVLLSPGSSSPDMTGAGDFVFRNYPSDALKTTAMARYLADNGYTRLATISENTDFSQAFRNSLKEKIGKDAFVFDEVVDPGTKDFRTLFARMKDKEFDVFFPNPNHDAIMALMVQQFREQGFEQEILSHDVAESLNIVEIAGDAVEGTRMINVPTAGEGTQFEKKFREKFGEPQGGITWGSFGYDAANVLFQAIKNVGTDSSAIRDYLYDLDGYDGVVGRFSFDANGDVLGIPYVIKEFKDGKIVKIADIAVD